MKSVGEFVFKGVEKKEGGEFTNDKGQLIKYKESYTLKVDELTHEGIFERKFKISLEQQSLLSKLKDLKPYEKIKLEFNITFFGNTIKIVPCEIIASNNK